MSVDRGNDIHLPCNVQGNPLPIFTLVLIKFYKEKTNYWFSHAIIIIIYMSLSIFKIYLGGFVFRTQVLYILYHRHNEYSPYNRY